MNNLGFTAFSFLALWIFYLQFKKYKSSLKKKAEILCLMKEDFRRNGMSLDPAQYSISEKGKKRSNKIERRFKRRYFFELLEVFDHKCFSCERVVKLECDHFFIPKSKGGNLMMKHKKGYWVCNSILLCRACNSRKEDFPPDVFFSGEKMKECISLLEKMSEIISAREV